MSLEPLQIANSPMDLSEIGHRSCSLRCGLHLTMHRYPGEMMKTLNLLPGPASSLHRTDRASRSTALPRTITKATITWVRSTLISKPPRLNHSYARRPVTAVDTLPTSATRGRIITTSPGRFTAVRPPWIPVTPPRTTRGPRRDICPPGRRPWTVPPRGRITTRHYLKKFWTWQHRVSAMKWEKETRLGSHSKGSRISAKRNDWKYWLDAIPDWMCNKFKVNV